MKMEVSRKAPARTVARYEVGRYDMTEYEIWSEGYAASGDRGGASLHGTATANSFAEACEIVLSGDFNFNKEQLTYWGCRLFGKETDARKTFG